MKAEFNQYSSINRLKVAVLRLGLDFGVMDFLDLDLNCFFGVLLFCFVFVFVAFSALGLLAATRNTHSNYSEFMFLYKYIHTYRLQQFNASTCCINAASSSSSSIRHSYKKIVTNEYIL